jgi:hypothetical protein
MSDKDKSGILIGYLRILRQKMLTWMLLVCDETVWLRHVKLSVY